jgi:hypothetical protein
LTKKARSGSESGYRSVSQWYRSADPDLYQNVTDPQYCKKNPDEIQTLLKKFAKPEVLRFCSLSVNSNNTFFLGLWVRTPLEIFRKEVPNLGFSFFVKSASG